MSRTIKPTKNKIKTRNRTIINSHYYNYKDLPKNKLNKIRLFNFSEWMEPSDTRTSLVFDWGPYKYKNRNLQNFYKYIYNKNLNNELNSEDKAKLYQFFTTLEEDAQRSTITIFDKDEDNGDIKPITLTNQYFFEYFDPFTKNQTKNIAGLIRKKIRKTRILVFVRSFTTNAPNDNKMRKNKRTYQIVKMG